MIVYTMIEPGQWLAYGPISTRALQRKFLESGVVRLAVLLAPIFVLSVLWSRPFARQLRSLFDATSRLGRGDLRARAEVITKDELGALAEEFNSMAARRAAEQDEQDALMQAIAHELGTPLARMRFSVEFLERARTVPELGAHLDSLIDELTLLDELVDELVAWVAKGEVPASSGDPAN